MAEQKGLIENIMDFFRNRDEIYVLGKILDGKYDFSKLSNKFKDNKEFMLQAINNQDIGHRLKIDREGKAEVEDSIIKYASQNLRNDKDIVLKAIEKNPDALEFASKELQDNDMVVRRAILNYNTTALQFASDRLKNNFDIVKTAVQMNPEVLKFASKELRNNEDIVKEAVAYDTEYFKFAGDKIKEQFPNVEKFTEKILYDNKEYALNELQHTMSNFNSVSDRLKNDKEFIGEIVTLGTGRNRLEFIPDKFKDDKDIVLKAMKTDGISLEFVSDRLKEDKEVVMTAVKNNWKALEFVPDKFKDDKDIIMEVVKQNGKALKLASENMQKDREIVLASITSTRYGTSNSLTTINEKFRDDKEIVMEAMSYSGGYGYELISDRLKNDKEVTYCYASQESFNITKILDKFKEDKEIIMRGIGSTWRESNYILENASPKFRDDKDVMLMAVKNYPPSLELASERLKNDIEVVRRAVEYDTYIQKDEDDNEKTYQDNYVFDNLVPNKIKEQFPTIEALLNSDKEIAKDNQWSKENDLDKSNTWTKKLDNDKSNDFER